MTKHTISFEIRRISNGYILTGDVENDIGSKDFPEEFYLDLDSLDIAISQHLGGAEKLASEIEECDNSTSGWISFR